MKKIVLAIAVLIFVSLGSAESTQWSTSNDWSSGSSSNIDMGGTFGLEEGDGESTVDDFNRDSLGPYTGDTGQASTVSSPNFEGSHSLETDGNNDAIYSYSGLENYPEPGDDFVVYIRSNFQETRFEGPQFNWGYGEGGSDSPDYTTRIRQGDIYLRGPGDCEDTNSHSLSTNTWYRVEVDTTTDGDVEKRVYTTGGSLEYTLSISCDASEFTDGDPGIRFRSGGFGTSWYDDWHILDEGFESDGWLRTGYNTFSEDMDPESFELDLDYNLNGEDVNVVVESDTGDTSNEINLDGASSLNVDGLSDENDRYRLYFELESSGDNTPEISSASLDGDVANEPPSVEDAWLEKDGSEFDADEDAVPREPTLIADVSDEFYTANDDLQVTFYEGNTGSNELGSVDAGNTNNAELDFDEHGLGAENGESYEWSVRVEDPEGETDSEGVAEFTTVYDPEINLVTPSDGETDVELEPSLEAEVRQQDSEEIFIEFTIRDNEGNSIDTYTETVTSSNYQEISFDEVGPVDEYSEEYSWDVEATLTNADYDTELTRDDSPTREFTTLHEVSVSQIGPDEDIVPLDTDLEVELDHSDSDRNVDIEFFLNEESQGEVQEAADGDEVSINVDLDPGETYEWYVVVDGEEDSETFTSETWSFDAVSEPEVSVVTPTDQEEEVSLQPLFEVFIEGDDYEVSYDLVVEDNEGNIQDTTGGLSTVEDGETVEWDLEASSLELEPGTEYGFTAEFDATNFEVDGSDTIEFTTAEMPSLESFSPDDDSTGHNNPSLEIEFENPNSGDTEIRFYDWENNDLLGAIETSGNIASFDTSEVSDFGGDASQDYFWYAEIEDMGSETILNTEDEEGEWKFRTSDVVEAEIEPIQGDQHNMNPGTADVGPEELQINVTNEQGLDMDEAEFFIQDEPLEQVNQINESEAVSVNITQKLGEEDDEDESFDWSVKVFEDNNEISSFSSTFTTHVVTADWIDESDPELPAEFNIYYADNSDETFLQGDGEHTLVGSTGEMSLNVANSELSEGDNNCFRVTAFNSAGESDAYPATGDSAECIEIGGEE